MVQREHHRSVIRKLRLFDPRGKHKKVDGFHETHWGVRKPWFVVGISRNLKIGLSVLLAN